MTPTGYPEIGYSSNNAVFKWVTDSVQIVDNFAAVRGAHSVKAGFTLQRNASLPSTLGQLVMLGGAVSQAWAHHKRVKRLDRWLREDLAEARRAVKGQEIVIHEAAVFGGRGFVDTLQ
jgi:hypothetical protein